MLEKFVIVKIKKENAPDYKIEYYDGAHIICIRCFKKEKKIKIDFDENNDRNEEFKENEIGNNDNNKNKYQKINCNICNKFHLKISDNYNDDNDEGKCCGGCYLF